MAKGIYKLTNKRTGKVYVGQTNNLARREKEHMSDLASGTHHNQRMQQDYNRGDRFSFQVLEHIEGTRDDLNRRENFQIWKHNSFHNGYNQTRGGDYTQSGQKYLNQRKYSRQSNDYRRRYKGKQYTTRTYNPNKDETSLGKCFAGILIVFILYYLIANFIINLITYGPSVLLDGILIVIQIGVIAVIAIILYFAGKKIREMLGKEKIDEKNTAHYIKCPNCKGMIWGKNPNRCPYCHYNFKTKIMEDNESKDKSKYVHCKICNHLIDVDFGICEYCGFDIHDAHEDEKQSEDVEHICSADECEKQSESVQCPICNKLIDVDFGICECCGFDINKKTENEDESEHINCPICNNVIKVKYGICDFCGFEIKD